MAAKSRRSRRNHWVTFTVSRLHFSKVKYNPSCYYGKSMRCCECVTNRRGIMDEQIAAVFTITRNFLKAMKHLYNYFLLESNDASHTHTADNMETSYKPLLVEFPLCCNLVTLRANSMIAYCTAGRDNSSSCWTRVVSDTFGVVMVAVLAEQLGVMVDLW